MYPAGEPPTKLAHEWTWEKFLIAAETCHKGEIRSACRSA